MVDYFSLALAQLLDLATDQQEVSPGLLGAFGLGKVLG